MEQISSPRLQAIVGRDKLAVDMSGHLISSIRSSHPFGSTEANTVVVGYSTNQVRVTAMNTSYATVLLHKIAGDAIYVSKIFS